jgi:aldehyde:ferredoxin oxidoreductase
VAYIGGRGFNVWYLYQHLPSGTDPLASENILLFSGGLLTGSSAPGSARLHINALSPLTGILGSSNIGGYAGPWLRSCNIAAIIITGKSAKPVYLDIDSNGARLEDAAHLWGQDAFETQDLIKQFHAKKKIRVLAIGPGGENRVSFAAIMTEKDHAAGRTGMGSVMGSKNLKALVISKGDHKHFPAVTPSQKNAVKTYATKIKNSSEFDFFSNFGGAGYVKWANDFGIMGSKNYGKIGTRHIEKVDGRQLGEKKIRSSGCFRCPVQCKADLKLDRPGCDEVFTRPEFEPMINLGPKCGLDDLNQIIKLDNLCGRLGVDSTSAATAIAFAMDLAEKNILPDELVGDLDLAWGNAATMEKLLYQMVADRGLGRILRLGVRKAAELIGKGSVKYAAHVKGLELTAYHPSAIMGSALGYAVSSRGGDYNNVYASLEYSWTEAEAEKEFGTKEAVNIKSIEAKGQLLKKAITTNIIVDCLGLCKVPVLTLLKSFNLEHEVRLIKGLTGLSLSRRDLFEAGERIAALEKLFNIRHAKEDIEDKLPDMFFSKDGEQGLTRQKFKTMLRDYYSAMGWNEKGIPPPPAEDTNSHISSIGGKKR